MKKHIFNIIFYGLIAVVVLFILLSILPGLFSAPVTIETAESYTYDECVDFYGIAVRDEVLISSGDAHDFVEFVASDGNRVGKDSVVAYYTSGNGGLDFQQIETLNTKIDILTDVISGNVQASSVVLEQNSHSSLLNYLNSVESGDLLLTSSSLPEVQRSLSKKDIKLNGTARYESALSEYSERKAALLASTGESEYPVKSPGAGFFYSGYDGYERFKLGDLEGLTVEKLNTLLNAAPDPIANTYIGKIQNSPVWYFAGIFDSELAADFSEGKQTVLKFDYPDGTIKNLAAVIYEISNDSEGKTAVLFECSSLTEKEFSLRKEDCSLVRNTYTGIKVSNSALRVVDGQDGVYVLVGQKVTFKPVTVVYSGDSFSIVAPSSSTSSKVLVENDSVVCGGKDMFDGKVINVQ